jgi:hypothetical protein
VLQPGDLAKPVSAGDRTAWNFQLDVTDTSTRTGAAVGRYYVRLTFKQAPPDPAKDATSADYWPKLSDFPQQ